MKMKMEMEVISTDVITPSSGTPDHLKMYKLSLIDQLMPPVLMPHVLFYPLLPNNNSLLIQTNTDISNHLKNTLSQILTIYYPLAGRINVDNNYIDCNDEGITYVEARSTCNIFDVISNPIPEEVNKFVPCDIGQVSHLSMVVQVTFFDGGGLAIGIAISHKIADAWSYCMFLNSWAATTRGHDHDILSPEFVSATLFPPRDVAARFSRTTTGTEKVEELIITKRFVFSASKISQIRDKYTKKGGGGDDENVISRRATRIEALSAFIWTRFIASIEANKDPTKIYCLLHVVNARTRIDPPLLSDHYFGNICWPAVVSVVPSSCGQDDEGIVDKMREAIRSVDVDYVNKLREGSQDIDRLMELKKAEVVWLRFASLCRLPIYEADFGWGKPVWVGSASLGFKNTVLFMDSLSEGDIEAWVQMKREDMAMFEADEQLLAFVSSDHK